MSDKETLLFANEAFYRCFADHDLKAMDDLWSRDAPVCCLHPGWGPIFDRTGIIASWAAILNAPEAPDIDCDNAHASIYGDFGSVVCFERLGGGVLIATNGFCREGSLWKMVHHQAGPTSAKPDVTTSEPGAQIH
jgi:hypothetical protein